MNFRFLNVPVYINPTFWIFLVFFTDLLTDPSMRGIIVGVVVLLSLLVHEYGHALTAMYFGATPSITLEAFGGRADYMNARMGFKEQFLITLNGPLFESLLIFLSYYLLQTHVFAGQPYVEYFLHVIMRLNILWCLLNLIPVAPLDGGMLLRYVLESKFGENGVKVSHLVSLACVAMVAPYLFYQGFFFFGALLLILGFRNYQELKRFQAPSTSENPFSLYLHACEAIREQEIEKTKALLKKLVKSKNVQYKHLAIEALAKLYVQDNERKKAYDLLLKADFNLLKETKPLLCKLAFEFGNYSFVVNHALEIYALESTHEIALLNSKAFGHLGHQTLEEGWLKTASGFISPS